MYVVNLCKKERLWSSLALRSLSFASSFNFMVIGMTPSFQARRSVEGCMLRTVVVPSLMVRSFQFGRSCEHSMQGSAYQRYMQAAELTRHVSLGEKFGAGLPWFRPYVEEH